MLVDAPIARVTEALLSIEPAHFRHVRLTMREVADSYLLYDADDALRDHALQSMTEAEAARDRAFGRTRWLLDDVYCVAHWLAQSGEISMIDLDDRVHKAPHPPLYRWPETPRPVAKTELEHYAAVADQGDPMAALCMAQALARTTLGITDWSRVYAYAQQAVLDTHLAPRAMRLMSRAAQHSVHDNARAARCFWACCAHLASPSETALLVPGTDYRRAVLALDADDLNRLDGIIARKGPDLRVDPLFTMDDILAMRVRTHGEAVSGTEHLAGTLRVRPPTAQEAAPEKVALLRDIHLGERADHIGSIDPSTAAPDFLATCLLTLPPAHMRHLRRHLPVGETAQLVIGRNDALADLIRRSMTDAAWRRLHEDFAGQRVSDVVRRSTLVHAYSLARWLSDIGEVRMTDLDGHAGGADRGLYTWPETALPDATAELAHYMDWTAKGIAFATLTAAHILTHDEDGRADAVQARPLAEAASNASRTAQRGLYLLADLADDAACGIDAPQAFWHAYRAYRKDPDVAVLLGLDGLHTRLGAQLGDGDMARLAKVFGGKTKARRALDDALS